MTGHLGKTVGVGSPSEAWPRAPGLGDLAEGEGSGDGWTWVMKSQRRG